MLHELTMIRPAYARAHDYFGLWAMHEAEFTGLVELIARTDLEQHGRAFEDDRPRTPEEKQKARERALAEEARELSELFGIEFQASESGLMVGTNGMAVIPLTGSLMKAQSSFGDGTSTVDARRKVRAAAADPGVKATLFRVESPGGTVAGIQEFSDEIAKLQGIKPTATQIEDLAASAAYWATSQTGLVGMNKTGMAGSIGVLNVVHDTSGRASDMKIKVHVIRSGAHKGMGVPGAEITDEHLAHLQDRANAIHGLFTKAVETGRKMAPGAVDALADGRMFVGQAAKDAGLVDAIQSMDDTVAQLMERAKPKTQVSVLKGLDEMTEPKPATLAELKAAFPTDAGFVLKQLEAGATLADAKGAWADVLQARLDARDKELADEKAKGTKRGVEPFKEGGKPAAEKPTFDNPVAEFNRLKAELVAKGHEPFKAAHMVAVKNPDLHLAFMEATNPSKRAREAISEMVESFDA